MPPKVHDFRICEGPSIAEPTAESPLPGLFQLISYVCSCMFIRVSWEVVLNIIKVMFGPSFKSICVGSDLRDYRGLQ